MGLDFIRRAAPSFTRVLDVRAVELRTPKLFTNSIPVVSRTACAEMAPGTKIVVGEKLLLRLLNNAVVVQRDNLVIAECKQPPSEFVSILRSAADVALGEVKSLLTFSQMVEIGIIK